MRNGLEINLWFWNWESNKHLVLWPIRTCSELALTLYLLLDQGAALLYQGHASRSELSQPGSSAGVILRSGKMKHLSWLLLSLGSLQELEDSGSLFIACLGMIKLFWLCKDAFVWRQWKTVVGSGSSRLASISFVEGPWKSSCIHEEPGQ